MDDSDRKVAPLPVMVAGGFVGGLIAGALQLGAGWLIGLALAGGIVLLVLTGHIQKAVADAQIGTFLGLSTVTVLPAGLIGFLVGQAVIGGG